MDEETEAVLKSAKKHCLLCHTMQRFKPDDKEKLAAQNDLSELTSFFSAQYDSLRKKDAPSEKIQEALQSKRYCMDLIDTCRTCQKDVDRVNRGLGNLAPLPRP